MSQESMDNLGFTEENSLKTELDRKREIAMRFVKINEDARKNVENYFKDLYEKDNQGSQPNNSK